MNGPCLEFCDRHLLEHEVKGKRIIDIGCRDSSFNIILNKFEPDEYIGIDMQEGPNVDIVCDANDLIERFGENSFDIVISAEMLEHAEDWKWVIHNFKTICKPGGILFITTRSKGFCFHGCPDDYSRFEAEDMVHIFSDCTIKAIIPDYVAPGIFVKAIKPLDFKEIDLKNYKVYDMAGEKPDEPVS